MADRDGLLLIPLRSEVRGDKQVARGGAHDVQYILIPYPATLDLVRYHALALQRDRVVRSKKFRQRDGQNRTECQAGWVKRTITCGNGGIKPFRDAAVGRPAHNRTSGSVFRIHPKEGR